VETTQKIIDDLQKLAKQFALYERDEEALYGALMGLGQEQISNTLATYKSVLSKFQPVNLLRYEILTHLSKGDLCLEENKIRGKNMLIRCLWRNCDYRDKEWGATPIDSFWIEATHEEAKAAVFPYLSPAAIGESHEFAERGKHIAEQIGNPARPYCFLVARDLSSIDPFHVHYPFHQLWGAYSPFETIPELHIEALEKLEDIALPVRTIF